MRKEKRIRDEKRGGEQRRSRLFFQDRKSEGICWLLLCHLLYQAVN